jgi:AcrR family transcriptional regulator
MGEIVNVRLYTCKTMGRPRTVSEDLVLDATAEAIGREGPGRLTLASVAATCGLSPATLVQRYGSKRGLLLALAARAPAGVPAVFARARRRTRSHLGALHAALADLAAMPDRATLANHLAFLQMDLADPEFGAFAAEHARAVQQEIRVLIDDAKGAGELRRDSDPASLAEAVQTAYNGALILWAIEGRGSLRARLRRAVDLALAVARP